MSVAVFAAAREVEAPSETYNPDCLHPPLVSTRYDLPQYRQQINDSQFMDPSNP